MMNYIELYEKVQNHFLSYNQLERFNHSTRVIKMALKLNNLHNLGLDEEKIKIAGLLHDYAKVYPKKELKEIIHKEYSDTRIILKAPATWHSFSGPVIVKQLLGVTDSSILDAICYHTTGKPEMNSLTKLIFIADYVEDGRKFATCLEARRIAMENLNQAVAYISKMTIDYLTEKQEFIYPLTYATYNYYKEKM